MMQRLLLLRACAHACSCTAVAVAVADEGTAAGFGAAAAGPQRRSGEGEQDVVVTLLLLMLLLLLLLQGGTQGGHGPRFVAAVRIVVGAAEEEGAQVNRLLSPRIKLGGGSLH